MVAAAFDTLAVTRDLESAGVERRQAEAIASAIGSAGERAATRADLKATAEHLDDRMGRIEDRMGHLDDRMGHLDDRMGHLEDRMGRIEDRMGRVEDKIDQFEDKMATKVELANLETRLTVRFYGVAVAIVAANTALTVGLLELLGGAS